MSTEELTKYKEVSTYNQSQILLYGKDAKLKSITITPYGDLLEKLKDN